MKLDTKFVTDDPELTAKMLAVIDELHTSGIEKTEDKIFALFENILNYFIYKTDIFPALKELEGEKKDKIMQELDNLAKSLANEHTITAGDLVHELIFKILLNQIIFLLFSS
jgi:hypothetical protein